MTQIFKLFHIKLSQELEAWKFWHAPFISLFLMLTCTLCCLHRPSALISWQITFLYSIEWSPIVLKSSLNVFLYAFTTESYALDSNRQSLLCHGLCFLIKHVKNLTCVSELPNWWVWLRLKSIEQKLQSEQNRRDKYVVVQLVPTGSLRKCLGFHRLWKLAFHCSQH